MKKIILMEIMAYLRRKNHDVGFRRKLKIAAGLGVVTFALVGGLLIWASIAGITYLSNMAGNAGADAGGKIESVMREAGAASLVGSRCLDQAQEFLSLRVWLERPIASNLDTLKTACLQKQVPAPCQGGECESSRNGTGASEEGGMI